MAPNQESSGDEPELGPAEYLAYRVLVERQHQDRKETGRTKFFKLCCITDSYLKSEFEREVNLPWHWYMYGGVVDEQSINQGVAFKTTSNYHDGYSYYPAKDVSEEHFDIDDATRKVIAEAALEVVKIHGKKNRDELERYQYRRFAPNDFIRTYSDLRWKLVGLTLDDVDGQQLPLEEFDSESETNYVVKELNQMLKSFPTETYNRIYDQYLVWDDTMRLLVEEDASPGRLHEFLEVFIKKLSMVCLRFEHAENIPPHRFKRWEDEIPEHLDELSGDVQKIRESLLKDRRKTDLLYSISDAYNRTVVEQIGEL